ncbi:MAG: hypothetical protein RMJ56_10750 [Gemmataceae bacterium]|nr:PspA/IM30 family protein [Gemmata sp.]MDW8198068.1 hypothetical protein [Gemmataceae bacterium]
MKLTAPPPPPPSGDDPSGTPSGTPDDANVRPSSDGESGLAPEAPAEPTPTSPPPRPMVWPGWYPTIDAAIAALVVVLAFASASFVARNSDLWIHLAAGQRLLAGTYWPGSDPFSYSGAERTWVNHAWLTDVVLYLLYGGQGQVLVIAKALMVALAFGVVLAIRRPSFPLWPWAVVTALAVLASAPQFTLRPYVVSMLFLALTLVVVFRWPQGASQRRLPLVIGGVFWLWANSDAWFFLGPLTLLLLIVGEWIHTTWLKSSAAAEADDLEPLPRLPTVATLAKALGVGVVACMVNPHHLRVWELPFELTGSAIAEVDPRFRTFLFSPLTDLYIRETGLGYNLNGLAYFILLIGGAALLGFGSGRLRGGHVALWIGFAAMSLKSIYAIPFFAIVAVPLVAAQLNAFSPRVQLRSWNDPVSRLLLLGSSMGRVVSLLGIVLLCGAAYPGWVHPEASNPAYTRRLAWGVEADPLLVRAAQQLQAWRDADKLPPETRGIITSMELANYVAWFAPHEKVFFNTRLNHHRPELADFVKLRQGLGLIALPDQRADLQEARDVLRKAKADYLAVSSASSVDGGALHARATELTVRLYKSWAEWVPWYLDGRTVVFGWKSPGEVAKPVVTQRRVDAVGLAFAPRTPLGEPELKQPLVAQSWADTLVHPVGLTPPGATEAMGWLLYREAPQQRQSIRANVTGPLVRLAGDNTPLLHQFIHNLTWQVPPVEPSASTDAIDRRAIALLAFWAARQAILENPDHPDAYWALALTLDDPQLPLSESERTLGRVIALRQCLSRLPPPEYYRPGQFQASPIEVALRLAETYLGPPLTRTNPATKKTEIVGFGGMLLGVEGLAELLGQVYIPDKQGNLSRVLLARVGRVQGDVRFLAADAAHDVMKLAAAYGSVTVGQETAEDTKKRVEELNRLVKIAEDERLRAQRQFDQAAARSTKLPDLVSAALTAGLPALALELLTKENTDLVKEYEKNDALAILTIIALQLALGQIENANDLIANNDKPENLKALEARGWLGLWLQLKYHKHLHAGQYKQAGEVWETMAGPGIGEVAKLQPLGPNFDKATLLQVIGQIFQTPDPAKRLEYMLRPAIPLVRSPLQPLLLSQWYSEWLLVNTVIRNSIAAQLQREAEFFFRRGVLSLLQADIPAAKRRFEQTRRRPPAGWGLSEIAATEALGYLELMQLAETRSPPK